MFKNLHNRFFPVPGFLLASSFGLNISDQALRFAKIISVNKGMKLDKFGESKIEPGVIESGRIKDFKKMEEILLTLRKEEGLKFARVSLPEELIHIFRVRLIKLEIKNLKESIEASLEKNIQLSTENAIFDYELLGEDEKSLEVQVVAVQKEIIEEYLSVFERAGILVFSFELEAQALVRAVIKKGDRETYMVVDFGEKNTVISVVSGGIVMFNSTVGVGGVALSSIIQKSLETTFDEAEKIKRENSVQRNAENKEIFPSFLNNISFLRDEIAKSFLYWHTHKDEDDQERPVIKKIILCGGSSNLVGLPEYFSTNMKVPVEVADVWINIISEEKKIHDLTFRQSLSFATALGLALADFDYD